MRRAGGVSVSSIWAQDVDIQPQEAQGLSRRQRLGRTLALAFSTLGIVYGDIGTSVLYVWSAIYPSGAVGVPHNVILGTASSIVWTITFIVLLKYVGLMLMADDHGEGGIYALYGIISRACNVRSVAKAHETDAALTRFEPRPPSCGSGLTAAVVRGAFERSRVLQGLLLGVVLLASNMIISDGVLTPAISVVSAVQGIQYQTSISNGAVVGITCAILVALFSIQRFGTQRISYLFAPAIFVWLLCNLGIGAYNISKEPSILRALSPSYMYYFWSGDAAGAWRKLGALMLCITGAEALYADLGHFSAASIRISFISLVYPSLVVAYLGQGAVILQRPEAAAAIFWESIPGNLGFYWFMVVIATAAAIIASQALITGAFSIIQQAITMNCFPRLTVRHTSQTVKGQIYISEVNWMLMLGAVAVVAIMQDAVKIGNAYGLAVITVMLLDTALLALVMLTSWGLHPALVATFWLAFTFVTAAFFSSNLEKVPKGAWFSLVLAAILSGICYLWYYGQRAKWEYIRANRVKLHDLFEETPPPAHEAASQQGGQTSIAAAEHGQLQESVPSQDRLQLQPLRLVGSKLPLGRAPGLGIYYTQLLHGVPPVLEQFVSKVPALHEVVVFLTVRHVPVSSVMPGERLLVRKLGFEGFFHVVARFGYVEEARIDSHFVDSMVQEITAYLDPSVADFHADSSLGGPPDLEDPTSPHNTQQHSRSGSLQLVRISMGGARAATPGPGEGGTPGKDAKAPLASSRASTPTITLSLAGVEHTSGGLPGATEEGEQGYWRPWVQQPSTLRRVQLRALGLTSSHQDFVHADATVSLPPLPHGERPSILEESAPRGAATVSGTAAIRLSQQLQRRLGKQPLLPVPERGAAAPLLPEVAPGAGPAAAGATVADSDATSPTQPGGDGQWARERRLLAAAKEHSAVHVIGRSTLFAAPSSSWFKVFVLEVLYATLSNNVRPSTDVYHLPRRGTLETSVVLEV